MVRLPGERSQKETLIPLGLVQERHLPAVVTSCDKGEVIPLLLPVHNFYLCNNKSLSNKTSCFFSESVCGSYPRSALGELHIEVQKPVLDMVQVLQMASVEGFSPVRWSQTAG